MNIFFSFWHNLIIQSRLFSLFAAHHEISFVSAFLRSLLITYLIILSVENKLFWKRSWILYPKICTEHELFFFYVLVTIVVMVAQDPKNTLLGRKMMWTAETKVLFYPLQEQFILTIIVSVYLQLNPCYRLMDTAPNETLSLITRKRFPIERIPFELSVYVDTFSLPLRSSLLM